MSKLALFKLEDYLSTREFKAPYMLCASDLETHSMQEILAMADDECRQMWGHLALDYTEPYGMPLLLEQVARLYGNAIDADNILSFAGAEEGIYCACHALLEAGDHAIVVTPCYQSLESIPASLCDVTQIELAHSAGWQLEIDRVAAAIKPQTKLLLINYPHNPTGAMLSHVQQHQLVELARKHNLWLFSDEVYRYLELDAGHRLPTIASLYEKGLSLGVMSKAFGLPGLRVGWIACQDRDLLLAMSNVKHYLSICNSAPSEVLALIALRNKDHILDRNLAIMHHNIALLDDFFDDYRDLLEWVRPIAGCTGFVRLKSSQPAYDFSDELLAAKGVVTLPNSVYDYAGNHFRIGFGRKNMPEALAQMRAFIDARNA